MDVKIETSYTPAEVRDLCAALVTSGLLSAQEVDKEATFFDKLELDFFSINNLLLPFLEKFVGHFMHERDLTVRLRGRDTFYQNFTLRLLRSSPLGQYAASCTIDSESGGLLVQAGQLSGGFTVTTYPAYLTEVSILLNQLLQQSGVDTAYHQIGFDEATYFLLLTKSQYQYLLHNRVLQFAGVEYPEIELWRTTLREEDLPF
jgi:hypothetical protein